MDPGEEVVPVLRVGGGARAFLAQQDLPLERARIADRARAPVADCHLGGAAQTIVAVGTGEQRIAAQTLRTSLISPIESKICGRVCREAAQRSEWLCGVGADDENERAGGECRRSAACRKALRGSERAAWGL